jgi:hypothetical protein
MEKASHAKRVAARNKILAIATQAAESADKEAIRRLFSKDQRKKIAAFCKKHNLDHLQVIEEIIEAGMEAKGIRQKRKNGVAR